MTSGERDKKFRAARREAVRQRPRIQRDTFREIQSLLGASLERIRATLAAQPSDFQQWSLPQLEQQIQAVMKEFGDRGSQAAAEGTRRAWETGQQLVDEPLKAGGVRISGLIQELDTRQLLAMRHFMTDRIKNIGAVAVNRINSELGLVVIGNQSPGEAITSITRLLREQSRDRALTIVRTEIGRVFSAAGQQRQLQAANVVPGLKKQWRRSGKVHSRAAHDAADGQIREVDEPFNVGGFELMYPRDPKAPASQTINCGCESLPHMENWEVQQPGRQPLSDAERARRIGSDFDRAANQ